MAVSDDAFKQFAVKTEQEERDRAAKASSGGYQRDFENVKYSGLEKGVMKIIRGLGGVPNSGQDKFTSRTVRHSQIVADDGKRIRVILPLKTENPAFILWKIIDRVTEVEWVNKAKVFVNERKHSDIFRMVSVNGYAEGTNQAKYDKGWAGRDYFVMNCIDRSMMDWHKENKHSVILSKQINTVNTDDGKVLEFAEEGVPAYGFTNLLALNIFKFYGDWCNYDLGVEKLGLMQSPFRLINASKHEEEVPEDLRDLIKSGPLTDEEKSWELYDLDKIFGVTSYTKLFNKLKLSIAKIDMALGSHYLDELKSLADLEAAKRKEQNEQAEAEKGAKDPDGSESAGLNPDPVPEARPAKRPQMQDVPADVVEPKGFATLTPSELSGITSWVPVDGKKWNIKYNVPGKQYECPQCETPAPETYAHCPGCGMSFA